MNTNKISKVYTRIGGIITIIAIFSTTLAGCEVIGGIFKAGIWVGILFVVILIAVVIGIISMFNKK